MSTIRIRIITCICLLTAGLPLAGCGAASHPQVASLSASGHAGTHPASGSAISNDGIPDPDGRPRPSLDATEKQEAALYDPYFACLRAHRYIGQVGARARLAVAAKCERLEPLAPWQLDPGNPQARAFVGATVTCLEGEGFHARADLVTNVTIQAPAWYVEYSPQSVGFRHATTAAQDSCQQQASR